MINNTTKRASQYRFFVVWGALFLAGLSIVAFAPHSWRSVGFIVVTPTVFMIAAAAWGFMICRLVTACGGDPSDGWVGVVVVISFMFVLSLCITYLQHHR